MACFIHTADWQLGAPNLPPACQYPLEKLVEAAKAKDIGIILCAGDIFHKAQPDQRTKDYLLKTIIDNQNTLFIFMAGNHDFINKNRDYSSLRYLSLLATFKRLSNVRVIEPGRYYTHESAIFWALDEWKDLADAEPPETRGKPIVAMWHGIVPGINIKTLAMDPERKRELADTVVEAGIHYIALGDIHRQWKIHDRCYYSGCLTQTSYLDELGALEVNVTTKDIKVSPLALDLPHKMNFRVEFTDGEDSEDDIIKFVKDKAAAGNLVKLKFNLPVEIYATINKAYVKEQLKTHCLALEFDNDPVLKTRSRVDIEKIANAQTVEQEVEIIMANETFDLDPNRLKKVVLDILKHSVSE